MAERREGVRRGWRRVEWVDRRDMMSWEVRLWAIWRRIELGRFRSCMLAVGLDGVWPKLVVEMRMGGGEGRLEAEDGKGDNEAVTGRVALRASY